MLPTVVPQLVANDGAKALRQAIADPERFACEPKVDGVRGLVVYQPGRVMEMRNRRGEKRDWLRGGFASASISLADMPCAQTGDGDPQKSTGSRMIGQVMQWPPPRPRPSSAPTMVMTSMPALRSSVLV